MNGLSGYELIEAVRREKLSRLVGCKHDRKKRP